MKKLLVVLTVLVFMGLSVTQVEAWCPYWEMNHSPYWNGNNTYNDYGNDDILREKLNQRIKEYDAVVSQEKPDPQRAREISREISELRQQLRSRYQQQGFYNYQGYCGTGPYCPWNQHGWNHGCCW